MIQWAKKDNAKERASRQALELHARVVVNAERPSQLDGQSEQEAPSTPPDPEEECQISRDKGQVMDAIAAFFALADDINVCIMQVRAGTRTI